MGVHTLTVLLLFNIRFLHFDLKCSVSVTDQNKKNYVFINQAMSWSSAQQYCRENYKDLAMIENQEENTEAQNAKPSNKVWIGLYREPWTWSDGSRSSFRNWYPSGSDNNGGNKHCGTENSEHVWGDEDCGIKRVFVFSK
uniref:C-type lectin domain-containing protein n=1 Tax=Oryzias sinensis TaxID=183150 RepID=A0A8C7YAV3_9TELE